MTVDLKTLKAGDTVHFRCGGKAVVVAIEPGSGTFRYAVGFKDAMGGLPTLHYYEPDGTKGRDDQLLGIVRIEPAPQPSVAEKCARAYERAVNKIRIQDEPISMDALTYDDKQDVLAVIAGAIAAAPRLTND